MQDWDGMEATNASRKLRREARLLAHHRIQSDYCSDCGGGCNDNQQAEGADPKDGDDSVMMVS